MLELNPNKRPSAQQVLENIWFQKFNEASNLDKPIGGNVLGNLRKFKADQQMQQATIMFIVNQLTTKEEREHLEKAFKQMDVNNDGKLSREELHNGFRNIFGEVSSQELDEIIQQADADGSGAIDYTAATMNKQILLSKEKLEMCFKLFDQDGSGSISLDELKTILGKTNKEEDEHVRQLLQEADTSGDGEIDLNEFKNLMLKLF